MRFTSSLASEFACMQSAAGPRSPALRKASFSPPRKLTSSEVRAGEEGVVARGFRGLRGCCAWDRSAPPPHSLEAWRRKQVQPTCGCCRAPREGCAEREWVSRSGSVGVGWQGLVGSLRSVGVTQKPWAWAFDTPVFSFFLNLIPNVIVTPGFFLLWVGCLLPL